MSLQTRNFNSEDLSRFRQYQRQSFETLSKVGRSLKAGESEIEVARRIRKAFHHQGVHHYFHVPVALFGERTSYPGDFGEFEALATDKKLEAGMPVILDAAPIYDGYLVDTSLPFAFGSNPLMDELTRQLQDFRPLIKDGVNAGKTLQAIELEVNEMMQDLGYLNCHRKHIGSVLGHRVMKVTNRPWNRLKIKQLGVRQVSWFYWKSILAKKGWQNDSPNWNQFKTSNHAPFHGLWAVEPHIAKNGVGTKFEEILVIGEDGAEWLDNDLPHTRFWNGEPMLSITKERVTGQA
jgi:Xaa-Pro aminopeptidase